MASMVLSSKCRHCCVNSCPRRLNTDLFAFVFFCSFRMFVVNCFSYILMQNFAVCLFAFRRGSQKMWRMTFKMDSLLMLSQTKKKGLHLVYCVALYLYCSVSLHAQSVFWTQVHWNVCRLNFSLYALSCTAGKQTPTQCIDDTIWGAILTCAQKLT